MGTEHRRDPRVAAYAKAVHAATSTPGYIRDLSRTGCQVAFVRELAVRPGDPVELTVIAEHDPRIAPFPLRLLARWARTDGIWFCVGGELPGNAAGEGQAAFEALVDYYGQEAGRPTSGPDQTPGGGSSAATARESRQRTRRG
jgi:hypothetical protein